MLSPSKLASIKMLAFGKRRTLFLPSTNHTLQKYTIDFFVSSFWQRFILRAAAFLGFGRNVNSQIYDCIGNFESLITSMEDLKSVDDILSSNNLVFGMRQGSKGIYQKDSLLAMFENGAPAYYAKIAVGDRADEMVHAEARVLQKLSTIGLLKGTVPELLHENIFFLKSRPFFLTTVSPFLDSKNSFEVQHERFLTQLGQSTSKLIEYEKTFEARYAATTIAKISSFLAQDLHAELEKAVKTIVNEIGDLILPSVLAHRDFAPWNIKWNDSGIYVFDWEYATEEANPLYDFLHFRLIQKVLFSGRFNQLTPQTIVNFLPEAHTYLHSAYPETIWNLQIIKHLMLAYLVNLILFYVDSSNRFDKDHPIVSMYYRLIINRNMWL